MRDLSGAQHLKRTTIGVTLAGGPIVARDRMLAGMKEGVCSNQKQDIPPMHLKTYLMVINEIPQMG